METAHPAKFQDTVEQALDIKIDIPERLQACMQKEKQATLLKSDYNLFKSTLIETF